MPKINKNAQENRFWLKNCNLVCFIWKEHDFVLSWLSLGEEKGGCYARYTGLGTLDHGTQPKLGISRSVMVYLQ